jgi:GNAT superfamily N-acetyltransferase
LAGGLDVNIKQIEPGDHVKGLSLGDPDFTVLKTFLEKDAHRFELQSLARTYAAYGALPNGTVQRLLGYVTLVCGEVVAREGDEELLEDPDPRFHYDHYPAVKIARLAVDRRARGFKLGRALVNLALGQAKNIVCPAVGCRFVVVDSKRQSTTFYEKCGFTMLDTSANRNRSAPIMWIDLNRVA